MRLSDEAVGLLDGSNRQFKKRYLFSVFLW